MSEDNRVSASQHNILAKASAKEIAVKRIFEKYKLDESLKFKHVVQDKTVKESST